jgi:hypothetical protein
MTAIGLSSLNNKENFMFTIEELIERTADIECPVKKAKILLEAEQRAQEAVSNQADPALSHEWYGTLNAQIAAVVHYLLDSTDVPLPNLPTFGPTLEEVQSAEYWYTEVRDEVDRKLAGMSMDDAVEAIRKSDQKSALTVKASYDGSDKKLPLL